MADAGHEIKALINRPSLSVCTKAYYEAFNLLNDARPVSFGGQGAIPLTEIEAYMRVDNITGWDERFHFMRMIKRMDAAYLKFKQDKQEEQDRRNKQRQQVGGSNLRPRGRNRR